VGAGLHPADLRLGGERGRLRLGREARSLLRAGALPGSQCAAVCLAAAEAGSLCLLELGRGVRANVDCYMPELGQRAVQHHLLWHHDAHAGGLAAAEEGGIERGGGKHLHGAATALLSGEGPR